jgi:hypothetical protein
MTDPLSYLPIHLSFAPDGGVVAMAWHATRPIERRWQGNGPNRTQALRALFGAIGAERFPPTTRWTVETDATRGVIQGRHARQPDGSVDVVLMPDDLCAGIGTFPRFVYVRCLPNGACRVGVVRSRSETVSIGPRRRARVSSPRIAWLAAGPLLPAEAAAFPAVSDGAIVGYATDVARRIIARAHQDPETPALGQRAWRRPGAVGAVLECGSGPFARSLLIQARDNATWAASWIVYRADPSQKRFVPFLTKVAEGRHARDVSVDAALPDADLADGLGTWFWDEVNPGLKDPIVFPGHPLLDRSPEYIPPALAQRLRSVIADAMAFSLRADDKPLFLMFRIAFNPMPTADAVLANGDPRFERFLSELINAALTEAKPEPFGAYQPRAGLRAESRLSGWNRVSRLLEVSIGPPASAHARLEAQRRFNRWAAASSLKLETAAGLRSYTRP